MLQFIMLGVGSSAAVQSASDVERFFKVPLGFLSWWFFFVVLALLCVLTLLGALFVVRYGVEAGVVAALQRQEKWRCKRELAAVSQRDDSPDIKE